MSVLQNKTINLNTSDILTSEDNHADCTFPMSRFGIQCVDSERLSMSLKMTQIPTRLSYLQNSGTQSVFVYTSNEAFPTGREARAGISSISVIYIAISDTVYQPPFVFNGDIYIAIPFYISQSVEDLVNVLNIGLDFRYAGDTEALTVFTINTHTGILEASHEEGQVAYPNLSLINQYFMFNTQSPQFNTLFTKEGERIARMLGINIVYDLAGGFSSTLIINSGSTIAQRNRDPWATYPTFITSDGLLIQTNLNLDSYSSANGGISNCLSQIPTKLAPITREYGVVVQGGETMLQEFKAGQILHRNQNINASHKTISSKTLENLRLQIKGNDNIQRFCNTNITYIIEMRWFI